MNCWSWFLVLKVTMYIYLFYFLILQDSTKILYDFDRTKKYEAKKMNEWILDQCFNPNSTTTIRAKWWRRILQFEPSNHSCAISRPTNCSKKNQCWEWPCKKIEGGLAPSLEVHLDRIIKVLWQQDASKGMQHNTSFYLFFVCKFG